MISFILFSTILLSFFALFSTNIFYNIFSVILLYICSSVLLFHFEINFIAFVFIMVYIGAIFIFFIFIIITLDLKESSYKFNKEFFNKYLIIYSIFIVIFLRETFLLNSNTNVLYFGSNIYTIKNFNYWLYSYIIQTYNDFMYFSMILFNNYIIYILLSGLMILFLLIFILYIIINLKQIKKNYIFFKKQYI